LLSNATRAATLGVAVQGFVWGLNSFDQWGVELGKVLASKVRTSMNQKRTKGEKLTEADGFNPSTTSLINRYLEGKVGAAVPVKHPVDPSRFLKPSWFEPLEPMT
jgi:glucose-6-phosphate isomerase